MTEHPEPPEPPQDAPEQADGPTKMKVVLVGGYENGTVRVFSIEKAERLIRLGHARRP